MNSKIITSIESYVGQFGIINFLLQTNDYYGGVFVSEDVDGPSFNNYYLILYSQKYISQHISFSYTGERNEDEDVITYTFRYNDSKIPPFEQRGDVKLFYNDEIKYTFDKIDINFFLEEAARVIESRRLFKDELKVLKIEDKKIIEFYNSIAEKDDFENIYDIINYFYGCREIFNIRFYGGSTLDLTDCELDKLPPSIKSLDKVENLTIANNYLQDGVEEISSLHNLKKLELFYNMISEIPRDIDYLKELEELIIEERFISSIPEEIGQLKKLKKLIIKSTSIARLPDNICDLTNLEELVIAENKNLEKIPDCIARFQNLTHLYLYNNNLCTIPDEVGELENLRVLNLSRNKLYYLPKTFSMLCRLEKLDVSKNRLDFLDKDIFEIESLNEINVKGNINLNIDELYTIMITKKLGDRINLIS